MVKDHIFLMFISLLVAFVAFNPFGGAPSSSHAPHAIHHKKAHHHHPIITPFDRCVANREEGEPGSLRYDLIHWYAVNEYYGAYSFLHETWKVAGGERYAYNANEATPTQQSIIFNYYSKIDPGSWPNTISPCLYLR